MGRPAARVGDWHMCPMFDGKSPHIGGPVAPPGATKVLIGGMPAATMGDKCICVGPPDTIAQGSSGVFIGGKPAARIFDSSMHGGKIMQGCSSVLIGETGGGASGLAAMPVEALIEVAKNLPPNAKEKMAQVVTMKQAAASGTPFCEKCAK